MVYFSSKWDGFALSNSAPEITAEKVLNASLWDFISGNTLRQLYRQIMSEVRRGKTLQFDFRCDSPDIRRFLNITISPWLMGGVQFKTRTIRTEKRAFQEIFEAHGTYTNKIITACSWCNKIQTGVDVWLEADEAIRALGFFETNAVPSLTHGMCRSCYDKVFAKLP